LGQMIANVGKRSKSQAKTEGENKEKSDLS
jgi:hypothetical protein